MPRVSLPPSLKKLKTFEVSLTQTTEDELRSHFTNLFSIFESKKYIYENRVSMALNVFLDGNPYLNHNWKKNKPKRPFKESLAWFGDNEAEMTEYMGFNQLFTDLISIKKNFDWDNIEDMIFEMEKFTNYMKTNQNDLAQLENYKYNYAKNNFEENNKEWVEEQKLIQEHASEHKYCYMLRINEEAGEDISEFLKCKFCKMEYERDVIRIAGIREYERKSSEAWELANAHRLVKNEETKVEDEKPKERGIEVCCEDCGFKTHYQRYFDLHLDEPLHKQAVNKKTWYCVACEVQCQSKIKHEEHLESTKHKKRIGEIKKPDYSCEKCNYVTNFKHHYDQHLESKKHLENSK